MLRHVRWSCFVDLVDVHIEIVVTVVQGRLLCSFVSSLIADVVMGLCARVNLGVCHIAIVSQ